MARNEKRKTVSHFFFFIPVLLENKKGIRYNGLKDSENIVKKCYIIQLAAKGKCNTIKGGEVNAGET